MGVRSVRWRIRQAGDMDRELAWSKPELGARVVGLASNGVCRKVYSQVREPVFWPVYWQVWEQTDENVRSEQ